MKLKKERINISIGPEMEEFGRSVLKESLKSMAETGEYGGMGGHGLEDHHGGKHSQTSIKMGDKVVNFRFFDD
ncbi:MAG: hypothetical protein ACTSRA_11165 [Promethearchaeota archaeon]